MLQRLPSSDRVRARSAVMVLELTLLKDQVSGERTGRSRCRRPLTVRDDRVRDVRAVSWLGVSLEHLLVISRIVISRIVQGALMFGKQAREDKASDAVVSDRPTLRRADAREARLSERPVGSTKMSFIAPCVASSRNAFTSVANWLWC